MKFRFGNLIEFEIDGTLVFVLGVLIMFTIITVESMK